MAIKIHKVNKIPLDEQLHQGGSSALQRYRNKAVGDVSVLRLLQYELYIMLFANLGGSLGYLIRKQMYTGLFRSTGRGLILGKGIVLRHPGRITIGTNVAVDDYVLMDASGAGEEGIVIGDNVIISRNCVIQGKLGSIRLGDKTDIGVNVVLSSISGIEIASSVLIAGNCYIGGARYNSGRTDVAIMEQGAYSRGPIHIGEGSWLGAGVVVLDGVKIGKGAIIGAGSVVTKDVKDFEVVAGVPARLIQTREGVVEG